MLRRVGAAPLRRGCPTQVAFNNPMSSSEPTAKAGPKENCVLATDQGIQFTSQASTAWLAASPRGAYTAARTLSGGASIFELSFHIQRLSTSAQAILALETIDSCLADDSSPSAVRRLLEPDELRPRVLRSLSTAIAAYQEAAASCNDPHHSSGGEELRVTVLITWDRSTGAPAPPIRVATHASALPPRPAPPIKVQVRGVGRHNATAKDSEWVRQRMDYEAMKACDVEEVLLSDGHGGVLEGLSSNFFAVYGGTTPPTLRTAGEGVLMGSVREAVLRVAQREGLRVVLLPPRLDELEEWEGAFVSSTSRLLLPVDSLEVPGAEPSISKQFERTPLVARLEEAVVEEVHNCSEPVE